MKVSRLFLLTAWLFSVLWVVSYLKTPSEAQVSNVTSDFGTKPNDFVFGYGYQYKGTPRASGHYGDAYSLPASISFNLGTRLVLKADATTLNSVEYSPNPRETGVGDSDIAASFVAAKESLTVPGVTLDYQLNLPTGDAATKLGSGQYGHRFSTSFSKGRNSWKFQGSFGDLFTRKQSGYLYSNIFFTAMSATYSFPRKNLSDAVPNLKTELDVIPPYSAVSPTQGLANKRYPTEMYSVFTFSFPLKWQTKLNLVGRAGITPYTPKGLIMVQFQHMFRRKQ